jgi:hypothetical protein
MGSKNYSFSSRCNKNGVLLSGMFSTLELLCGRGLFLFVYFRLINGDFVFSGNALGRAK